MRRQFKKGNICVYIADSLCYTVETNSIVKQLFSSEIYVCVYIYIYRRDWGTELKWTDMHTHTVQWFPCHFNGAISSTLQNKKGNKIPLIPLGKKSKQT